MSAPHSAAQTGTIGDAIPGDASLAVVCVLIPAWQPHASLVLLATDLCERGFGKLLIVDDGSTPDFGTIFDDIAGMPRTEVLRHIVNAGKGRSLKTGFQQLLNAPGDLLGVVTADADGQHTPEDIEKIARALLAGSAQPVLGSRSFSQAVPWRSRLGNTLTRYVFKRLSGVSVADTQTGLRGLPLALLPELVALRGERYEYEMTMLAYLCRSGRRPLEVPVATVYLDNNRGSHFHPLWDSLRIYLVLLRSLPIFAARPRR